ncbi:FliM/FliN family flagellar motor switch protein [Burkholderia dolosa]|uniref:Flagellar motor switch protein FliN n=1 Tax=Burkholderia dolosa TaxID=152500 RepID=A0A892IHA3_9BURK|nr:MULTISPECIES: FliM/FliN family flagellar motor switch protein [Burkholderia]AKE05310.1 flagellar motor switch protein FliN [Burkholderia cepacia]AJY10027.1 surface presentation of antigens family protein [Burkholderia dolosa AU0158]AYZ94382.1 flagellar motor switch protein FliN [Burkholderia dolosa]ETP63583.1 flagellar motor switch protein FliN [Burkholderia dolosa PC543]MBR8415791.1 FliM/FliN family flagellar motor switch protein [Burkholderia dolosa]
MNQNDDLNLDAALDDFPDAPADGGPSAGAAGASLRMLRRIPVRLTLEVGGATVPLADLLGYGTGSIVELDRIAGEPLVVKVNGLPIGAAEVVVCGDNYGMKLVELGDLSSLTT